MTKVILKDNDDGRIQATVEHLSGDIAVKFHSDFGRQHSLDYALTFDDPDDALKLAEALREAASAAQIYQENDPHRD